MNYTGQNSPQSPLNSFYLYEFCRSNLSPSEDRSLADSFYLIDKEGRFQLIENKPEDK